VGVPQVWPAKRPVEEAMLVMPGVKGWVEGGVLLLGDLRCKEEEEEREEEEEEGEVGGRG
jgi:hypothetical protein